MRRFSLVNHTRETINERYSFTYYCTMAVLLFIFLDSAALLMLNYQELYLFGRIQTSQTGDQQYSVPSLSYSLSIIV